LWVSLPRGHGSPSVTRIGVEVKGVRDDLAPPKLRFVSDQAIQEITRPTFSQRTTSKTNYAQVILFFAQLALPSGLAKESCSAIDL